MKKWLVRVYEEFGSTYEVEAKTAEEAEEIAEEMCVEGVEPANSWCAERQCEAEEIKG